jgi:hypothetical protein
MNKPAGNKSDVVPSVEGSSIDNIRVVLVIADWGISSFQRCHGFFRSFRSPGNFPLSPWIVSVVRDFAGRSPVSVDQSSCRNLHVPVRRSMVPEQWVVIRGRGFRIGLK